MSDVEASVVTYLRVLGGDLPKPEREYRFDPKRRWRFDFAWPLRRVALEADGGQWMPGGGRHARDVDRWKLNAAAAQGWRVLRVSGEMLKKDPDRVVDDLRAALEVGGET